MGVGLPVALALGVVGAAIAYADWLGLDRSALAPRAGRLGTATAVGFGGLVVGNLVAVFPLLAFGDALAPTTEFALLTVLFGVGLGIVAAYFLATTDRGFDYLDVAAPDRRDAVYTAGGILAIFGLLVGLGLLSEALGIGGSESSIVTEARQNPEILLALIPLSYLVIATGEELLFRNVVQKHLREVYSATGAVLLGTAVFTVMHVPTYYSPDPVVMLSTLIRLFLLSLVLGITYERTRNVAVPVLIHGTFDAVQFAALYVSLTGGFGSIV